MATTSELDIYASANLLIREHGSEAHSIATNRADVLKAAGDEAGYAAFTRIAVAVKELGQLKPAAGEFHVEDIGSDDRCAAARNRKGRLRRHYSAGRGVG